MFIDEFDAFYHYELAETIVKLLEAMQGFQTILTSHNTNLLSNRIMRPDCYFILTANKLTSFANATERELREGHNLEKLYMSGAYMAEHKRKILILVEGAKTDAALMERLLAIYSIDAKYEIVSYCTNIYALYREKAEKQ